MAVVERQLTQRKSPAKKYQERVTAPKTAMDWDLAIADPLCVIGREYYTLALKQYLAHKEIIHFMEKLAFLNNIEQQRVKEHLLREMEYKYECERERLLLSYTNAQLKEVPLEETSESTKGLLAELLELILNASKWMAMIGELTMKLSNIETQWKKWHLSRAQSIVNALLNLNELSADKKEQLYQALIPSSPALALKLNPYLAKKVLELEAGLQVKNTKQPINSICLNMAKLNNAMSELTVYSILGADAKTNERLMGTALLDAIKNRRTEFNNIFSASDNETQAEMIREGAHILGQKHVAKEQLKQTMQEITTKRTAFNKQLAMEQKLTPNSKKRNLPEDFDPYAGPLRKRPRYS